ncbi:MAG: hypothetical protein ACFB9N_16160 [Geitlerinemataceae cyanobacterium]
MTAPCIINAGTIVSKSDMLRALSRLTHVRYTHLWDDESRSQGSATIAEVFDDPQQSTVLANRLLYLNIHSFDYLELRPAENGKTIFALVRGDEQLCLESAAHKPSTTFAGIDMLDRDSAFGESTLEFALAHIIAAKLDAQLDSDGDIDRSTW